MRRVALITLLLMPMSLICQGATVYQWTDRQGVIHFTDSMKNVPESYRDKVKSRDMGPDRSPQSETGAAPGGALGPAPAPPSAGRPSDETFGGRTGLWWRNRFEAVRTQIVALQNGLGAKEQRLVEVRRRHTIFQRPADRVAANEVAADVDRDQARITELQGELATLQQEADRAGVPAEWR